MWCRHKSEVDYTFCDFGESRFHLREAEGSIFLSVALPSYRELHALGLREHLQSRLGSDLELVGSTESGYDFTLRVAADGLTGRE